MARTNSHTLPMLIALFALLPFKTVAKATLVFAAAIFILNPFPLSRLYAFIAMMVVQVLGKLHSQIEEPKESSGGPMLLFDTHVHLWRADNLPPWLAGDDSLAPIAISRSLDDYVDEMGRTRLSRCIYMEVDVAPSAREAEALAIVQMCKKPDSPLAGAVIGAPVVDGSVEEFRVWVERWAAVPQIKGVRQVMHPQPPGTCVRPDIVAKARLCGELDLVFELCMRADDLMSAVDLAELCPETRLVLDHCGGHHQLTGESAPAMREAWESGIKALSTQPNVYCKLSGLMGAQGGAEEGSGSGGGGWTPEGQIQTVRFCVDHFRRDRLMFGGDWPVCTLSASLGAWADCCEALLEAAGWGEDEKAALSQTAIECYRI
jgi:L-fuconolactonase